jgi:hypothetical protein
LSLKASLTASFTACLHRAISYFPKTGHSIPDERIWLGQNLNRHVR